jgi:hypothetical protein
VLATISGNIERSRTGLEFDSMLMYGRLWERVCKKEFGLDEMS